jgi:hypothetical protein
MTSSHVFVVLGDLTRLNCDAWMLPTSSAMGIRSYWRVDGVEAAAEKSRRPDFGSASLMVMPMRDWSLERPLPVLTAVPAGGVRRASDIEFTLREFVRVAAAEAKSRWNRRPVEAQVRPRPLLALPFFGSRGGGGQALRGELLETILRVVREEGNRTQVDIALVLKDERAFALAQVIRKRNPNESWPQFAENDLLDRAKVLAEYARDGRLVPFMGAGVSVSAGAPDWAKLIAALAIKAGLTPEAQDVLRKSGRNFLDQAAYLRAVFVESSPTGSTKADGGFADVIAETVRLTRYGLAPALLASLKTEQAITLNYDELFEFAAIDAGDPRAVIPDGTMGKSNKWLLKLHGTVANPESIVLTRDDYLGYSTSREALSAIVKATLITHHLLFVGFGLADDHFHQILHDVRRALPNGMSETTELATALTLRRDPLEAKLWQGRLGLVPMGEAESGKVESARTLEIFLDALLAHATDSHSYLLAPGYEEVLNESDIALRQALLAFAGEADDTQRSADSWRAVAKLLKELGMRQDEFHEPRGHSHARRATFHRGVPDQRH